MAFQNNSNINPGLYIMFSDLKDDNGLIILNYQPYKYTDYNDCNSAHDSDMLNLFTTFSDWKYYSGNIFSTFNKPLAPGIYFIHLNARSVNVAP